MVKYTQPDGTSKVESLTLATSSKEARAQLKAWKANAQSCSSLAAVKKNAATFRASNGFEAKAWIEVVQ
jgi:hypothetical protein